MEKFTAVVSSKCEHTAGRHSVRMSSANWEAWMTARGQGEILALSGAKDVTVDYFMDDRWVAASIAHRSMDAITECDQPMELLRYS